MSAERCWTPIFNESRPAVSPDGRWLAYQSDETGQFEIYVRPFPDVDSGKWTVSSGGGEEPRWSGDSRTLFFLEPTSLMETRVADAATFTHDTPEPLFALEEYYIPAATPHRYDVSNDGERFLLMRRSSNEAAGVNLRQVIVVTNWIEELNRRVPTQ